MVVWILCKETYSKHLRPLTSDYLSSRAGTAWNKRGAPAGPSLRASRGDPVRSESLRTPGMSLGTCRCCPRARKQETRPRSRGRGGSARKAESGLRVRDPGTGSRTGTAGVPPPERSAGGGWPSWCLAVASCAELLTPRTIDPWNYYADERNGPPEDQDTVIVLPFPLGYDDCR
jgi:hypothetical protein